MKESSMQVNLFLLFYIFYVLVDIKFPSIVIDGINIYIRKKYEATQQSSGLLFNAVVYFSTNTGTYVGFNSRGNFNLKWK